MVVEMPSLDEVEEIEPAAAIDTEAETMAAADIDRHVIASAPIAEAPAVQPEAVAAPAPTPEPEIDFSREEKPQKEIEEPEVKTVKVRSSVDVMAELEALRKRATNTSPKAPKKDILADLARLRPKRDLQRTLNLQLSPDVLPKTKSVRVTLSFEDEAGVIETQHQEVELGDTSDVQSLSVNLKIDLA